VNFGKISKWHIFLLLTNTLNDLFACGRGTCCWIREKIRNSYHAVQGMVWDDF